MCFSRLRRMFGRDGRDTPSGQAVTTTVLTSRVSVRAGFAILGDIPQVEPRLSRVLGWIASTSGLDLAGDRQYFADVPEIPADSQGLGPGQLDLSLFPDVPFIVALYFSPIGRSGLTYPFYDWRGDGQRCTIATIPYVPSYGPEPFAGFETHFEQVIAHEIKNSIISWLNQGLGYSVLNTYQEDGAWINCDLYPEGTRYTDCYREVFRQLTDAMRQDLAAL